MLSPDSDTAYVFGKPLLLKSTPIIVNGVTLAPLDFFVEQLGLDLFWDPVLYQVAMRTDENTGWLSFAAYRVNEEIMVPVKPLASAKGYLVNWNQEGNFVEITGQDLK